MPRVSPGCPIGQAVQEGQEEEEGRAGPAPTSAGNTPDSNRPVTTAGGEMRSVRTYSKRVHRARVPQQRGPRPARLGVPQPHRSVLAGAGQDRAVGGEGDRPHVLLVASPD